MKSIQGKIITFILLYLLLLAIAIGSVSIYNSSQMSKFDSETMLTEICSEQGLLLNNQLKVIEHAVDTIYGYAANQISAAHLSDREYFDAYTESVRAVALELANHTDGSLAVYFRYNPNLVHTKNEGFLWSRPGEDDAFTEQPLTDILAYGVSDTEYVGWYYIPVQTGKAAWMAPYYNQKYGKETISYVIPFYVDYQLIGVIGMDIDFRIFIDMAENFALYDGESSIYIANPKNRMLYKKTDEKIESLTLNDDLYSIITADKKLNSLCEIDLEGEANMLAFDTLSNDMKIIITAPVSEINAARNQLIVNTIVLTCVILALAVLSALFVTKRIIKPLKELTVASEQFAEGNWDVSIDCSTNDEVKRLTDSILIMAGKTQEYIEELNQQAMRDGLTGVKNKACYMDSVHTLEDQINGNSLSFAVVVLDVNGLKQINDNYGHELGDALIIKACQVICQVFLHSAVFRIGGDEFAVILQNSDYERKEALLAKLEQETAYIVLDSEKNLSFSIAYGIALFPEDADNYEAVFELADKRMYKKKAEMKAKR